MRGGYRDRVVVELAQNAADAATRAGVPGRLVLRLAGDRLTAANTGAPLDAAGVEALSTLRASTKRADDAGRTAGRFGVGFAAVLAVSDEPEILSGTGAVRWDVSRARAEVARLESLREELGRRGGQVPVLRLPFPSTRRPPAGATTVVDLLLRDGASVALVRRLLGEVDDALLLALPSLAQIEVEVDGVARVVSDEGRWHVVRRAGRSDPHLLADRPVEERARPSWSVTWARPLAGQPLPGTLYAPTPTDEPLGLPAMLIASFPLDTTRRHVAPGPLTDFLVGQAAAAYVELVSHCIERPDPTGCLDLVPGPLPLGRLDGQLRSGVTAALSGAPVLRTPGGAAVAPRDAVSVVGVDHGVLAALDGVVSGLVPDHPDLGRLGGRRLRLADAVDLLAGLERPPRWWHDLYAALAAAGPVDTEALGALPVPLADGRVVRGPRGALVPEGGLGLDLSAFPGLRLVHPGAAHPLLLRLGAAAATARTVLERPEVRRSVETWEEHEDPAGLAEAVLGLVAAAGPGPGELPWLAGLGLSDDTGERVAADELVLAGSVLDGLAGAGTLGSVAADLAARWGPQVLASVGVLVDLRVVECHDVLLDAASVDRVEADAGCAALPDLADYVEWVLERVGPTDLPPTVRTLRGVGELDVVADDAWERFLARVSGEPDLRSALVDPVEVDLGPRGRVLVPSYLSWWLRTRASLRGRPPGDWALAPADGLGGLYDVLDLPPGSDEAVLDAAGVRVSLEGMLAGPEGADDLLVRLGDPARTVPAANLAAAYRALAAADPGSVTPPDRLRVRPDLVVPAADVVVVDRPHHLQLPWSPPALVVPLVWAADLAEVLDVAGSSERVEEPALAGTARPVPDAVRRLLPGLPGLPDRWQEHEEITVAGADVAWWVTDDGKVHAATLEGLARGLAWAAGHWELRLVVAAVLEAGGDPDRVEELLTESLLDGR